MDVTEYGFSDPEEPNLYKPMPFERTSESSKGLDLRVSAGSLQSRRSLSQW